MKSNLEAKSGQIIICLTILFYTSCPQLNLVKLGFSIPFFFFPFTTAAARFP